MKKLIKILFCFILIASVLCTMPAYANYNAVYELSLIHISEPTRP